MKEQPRFKEWLRPTRTRVLMLVIAGVFVFGLLTSRTSPVGVFASDPPSETDSRAPENLAAEQLRTVRQSIWLYRRDHDGTPPPFDAMTGDWPGLTEQSTGSDGFVFGPYLQQAPRNPFTLSNTVARPGFANTTDGWEYNPMTGEIRMVLPDRSLMNEDTFPADYFVVANRR